MRLRKLREEFKLSQKKLGGYVSLTQQQIDNYEKGKYEPDINTLLRLADFFNVTLDYLIGRSEVRQWKQEGDWHYASTLLDKLEHFCSESREIIGNLHPSYDVHKQADKIIAQLHDRNIINAMQIDTAKNYILNCLME